MTLAVVLTSVLLQDFNVYSSSNLLGSGFYSRLRGQALSTVLGSDSLSTAICHSLVVAVMIRDPHCNG